MIAAINERNDLFSLSYNFDRGYRKAPLLCHALKLLERSGAGDIPADELQKKLHALGTRVRTSCNAEGSSLNLSGVDANLQASLELVEKWFRNPTFDDEVVAKLLENTLSTRKDQTEDPDYLAQALVDYANFGKRSAWLLQPSNAKLQRAKGRQLGKLLETFLDHEHRTLYFGPRAAKQAAEVVALGKKHRKVGQRRPRRYRKVRRPTAYFLHKDVAKSTIGIVFPDKPLPRERRPIARLYTEYLSGNMSSLIFQEIREARGLAYYAYGYYDSGPRKKDDASLLGRMGTQADKTSYALETLLGLIQKRAIEADRVAEAKTSLEQSYRATRVDPRWINRWVLGWDELGEKEDPRPWEREEVRKLESKDIEAFAAQFAEQPLIISVTGDRGRVDVEALKKIAPITEVEADDLFSYGKFPAAKAEPTKGKKK
jgi:predicted Zn-dependent peptidase